MSLEDEQKKSAWKQAFILSLPIFLSYIFLGIAYGILLQDAGGQWYHALFASFFLYTGAFQFMLTTLLVSKASLLTISLSAFLLNSRQSFYALTFVDLFRKMKKKLPFLIHTVTDETYGVDVMLKETEAEERQIELIPKIALFSWMYWITGSILGVVIGSLLPFQLNGIDFCMTALFVIILMGQLKKKSNWIPALMGFACALICLWIFKDNFMLPALLSLSVLLVIYNMKKAQTETVKDNKEEGNVTIADKALDEKSYSKEAVQVTQTAGFSKKASLSGNDSQTAGISTNIAVKASEGEKV